MALDLLSIGDASLDVFLTPVESETFCRLDTKECFISFSYGDKIPVKRMEFTVGGNAANNAVGTKRLGINSGLVTTMGEDMVGSQILEQLEKQMSEIDAALERIENGTYGICEISGQPIEKERLEANPSARTCIKHMKK